MIAEYLGEKVTVRIDRPIGSRHPDCGFLYMLNYGYVPGTMALDGEEIDAYVLGEESPVQECTGRVIAVIKRLDDIEDKLVVSTTGKRYSKEEIMRRVDFQEKYFKTKIILFDDHPDTLGLEGK